MMQGKIAFIRMGSFPHANESMARALRESFPDLRLEVLEIVQLVKQRRFLVLLNGFFTIKEYLVPMLLGHRKPSECFFQTTFMFRTISKMVRKHVRRGGYVFSFQMQSLFDASSPGIPHFLYTDHTHMANLEYPNFSEKRLASRAWRQLERIIYQNATVNFVRSSNIKRSLICQYGCRPESVRCIYAGPNSEVAPAERGEDPGRVDILFVGIDWERKGGPELLGAFRQVLSEHPEAHLTIVGCSPAVELESCTVTGRVPLDEIHRYEGRASIFCLPTKLEPFGIAFIEALHHGLPIVATNVGAIPDFVTHEHNGLLVSPGEVEQLARALSRLIGDSDLRQVFGERGRRLAKERYVWAEVGNRARESIEATISSGSLAP